MTKVMYLGILQMFTGFLVLYTEVVPFKLALVGSMLIILGLQISLLIKPD